MVTHDRSYSSLTIRGVRYDREELLRVSEEKLQHRSTPPWEYQVYYFIQQWLDINDSITLSTSGSTGKPKKLSFKKRFMVASALSTRDYFSLKPNDSVLMCLPAHYIAGKMLIVRAFVIGLDLHFVEPCRDPLGFADYQQFKISSMVPLQVLSILASRDGAERLSQIEILLIGGSPLQEERCRQLKEQGVNAFITYGMTETVSHIAVRSILKDQRCFHCLPGINVSLDDRNCLVVTANHLGIKHLVTNDLAEVYSDSSFLILGRVDNVINTGSVKVHPEIIEEKLAKIIPQQRFFIFAEQDAILLNTVSLLVEGSKVDDHTLDHWKQSFIDCLDRFETPKFVHFHESFVTTDSGKIKRRETIQAFYDQNRCNHLN